MKRTFKTRYAACRSRFTARLRGTRSESNHGHRPLLRMAVALLLCAAFAPALHGQTRRGPQRNQRRSKLRRVRQTGRTRPATPATKSRRKTTKKPASRRRRETRKQIAQAVKIVPLAVGRRAFTRPQTLQLIKKKLNVNAGNLTTAPAPSSYTLTPIRPYIAGKGALGFPQGQLQTLETKSPYALVPVMRVNQAFHLSLNVRMQKGKRYLVELSIEVNKGGTLVFAPHEGNAAPSVYHPPEGAISQKLAPGAHTILLAVESEKTGRTQFAARFFGGGGTASSTYMDFHSARIEKVDP